MKNIKYLVLSALLITSSFTAFATDSTTTKKSKGNLSLATDLVSSYVWRGTSLAGVSLQPTIGFDIAGFSVSAWGSTDFNYGSSGYSELDFTIGYSNWGASLSLTDYCWTNALGNFDYFGAYTNNHYLEIGVGFNFGEYFEKVPISISVNTMLYGATTTFPTYISIAYTYPVKGIVDLNAEVGAAIEKTGGFYSPNAGFSVTNVSLGASRVFDIKGKVDIVLKADLICNPAAVGTGFGSGPINFVAGVGFSL